MKKLMFGAVILGSLALSGAVAAQNEPTGSRPQMGQMAMMQNCPMKVQGADLAVADTTDGISLTITTKSGDVAELRRRVESMAKMHSASSNESMMHGQMPSFAVKYEGVPSGARLTLTPKDPEQLEELRTKVRQHAEQMKKGTCSMMQGMMGGMRNSKPTPGSEPESTLDESDHSAHHPPEDKK